MDGTTVLRPTATAEKNNSANPPFRGRLMLDEKIIGHRVLSVLSHQRSRKMTMADGNGAADVAEPNLSLPRMNRISPFIT
jgi:hypothetical protein